MRCVLSQLVREERLLVVEDFKVESLKTRDLAAKLATFGVSDVLLLVEEPSAELLLASRNLHSVAVAEGRDVNPVTLIAFDKVIATKASLQALEERLQ